MTPMAVEQTARLTTARLEALRINLANAEALHEAQLKGENDIDIRRIDGLTKEKFFKLVKFLKEEL